MTRAALRLAAVWGALAIFLIVTTGTFVPIDLGEGLEYLFLPPEPYVALRLLAGSLIGLLAIVVVVIALVRMRAPGSLSRVMALEWMTPLAFSGVVALGLAPAVRGVGAYGAVLAYLFLDLKWYWAALGVFLTLWRLSRVLASPWTFPALPGFRSAALFSAVVTMAIVTAPQLRWSGGLHGDEPKYLRYSDALAQGLGFDVSSRTPFQEQGDSARSAVMRNLLHLPRAIATDLAAMVSDLRAYLAHPSVFEWNRVSGADGFFTGRHGGVYQIHPPGLSMILLPGYTIDRFVLGGEPGYQGEFPGGLVMTTSTMVVLLGACGLALYRLLRRVLDHELLAWIWAFIGASMLPLSAFGFQIYPEVPAALIILLTATAVLIQPPEPWRLAFAAAGAAALVWLHPRFLIVAAVLIAIAWYRATGRGRRVVAVAAAATIGTFCAYNYHVTGSPWPLAVFDVFASEVSVSLRGVPLNLIAYAFDRTWGVVAHTPILIFAAAGLVLIWQRDRLSAVAIPAIVLAAAVPAAAHSLSAAGGTPGRLIAAVMPLLIWPLSVFVRWAWRQRAVAIVIVLLVIVTLDNAISYNLGHVKGAGPLRDWTGTGWKIHQAFPAIRGEVWETSWLNFMVLLGLIGVALVAAWWVVRRRESEAAKVPSWPSWRVTTAALAGIAAGATAVTAATGQWTRGDYLPRPGTALAAAAEALAPRDICRGCLSSKRGRVQWRDLRPTVDRFRVETDVAEQTVIARVSLESDSSAAALARVRIEFGDGSESGWRAVLHQREIRHHYARPGRYEVVTWVEWGAGGHRSDRRVIDVPAAAGGRPTF